jgi:hypothetical protein
VICGLDDSIAVFDASCVFLSVFLNIYIDFQISILVMSENVPLIKEQTPKNLVVK